MLKLKLKRILKYTAKLYGKFDISPMGKYSFVKLLIFLSWIFNVLSFISSDFITDNFPQQHSSRKCYYDNSTEDLAPVEMPAAIETNFSRSEIGTISSFNVIILPQEPFYFERDRSPPFHFFSA